MAIKSPPERIELSDVYPKPSNAVLRAGIGRFWDYVTSLLGATGDPADAREALGAVGKSGDETIIGTKTFSGGVNVQNINGSHLAGFRNRLINGDFRVWQRGTTFDCPANVLTYTADQWAVYTTGSAVNASRALNEMTANSTFTLRVTGASGNTSVNLLQRIPGVDAIALQNRPSTVSFWAKASAPLSLNWMAVHATVADNFAATAPISSGTINLTTTPQLFTLPVSATGNAYLGLQLSLVAYGLGAGVSFTVDKVQWEPGTLATPFEQLDQATELVRCQRFYEAGQFFLEAYGSANQNLGAFIQFKVNKPSAPTMTAVHVGSIGVTSAANLWSVDGRGARFAGAKDSVAGAFLLSVAWTAASVL
ncbi:MAG: hypothetical protein H6R01_933 [Burkholderiaceae bacterium]|nr:hypothetical protein [Burkholderiaceae bacterium]